MPSKYSKLSPDLQVLVKRFYGIKHRCGERSSKVYRKIAFGFSSARAAADYCLATLGPLPSRLHQIDRIDSRLGYEPGNLRYATQAENLANRKFKVRQQFQTANADWLALVSQSSDPAATLSGCDGR
jgi:hypothetical protein